MLPVFVVHVEDIFSDNAAKETGSDVCKKTKTTKKKGQAIIKGMCYFCNHLFFF